MRRIWIAAAAVAVAMASPAVAQEAAQAQKQRFGSVQEAVQASGRLGGSAGPASVNWIEGGEQYSYTIRNPRTRRAEVRRFDPRTLSDQLLFDEGSLVLAGENQPIQYRSFEFSQDSRTVVFQTNFRPIYRNSGLSDFYLYDVESGKLTLGARDARTADLSPDGSLLGIERGGNLFVIDPATGEERQLTHVDGDSIFNGHFDWVYEEEFGFAQAWEWSPDDRRIAYWQTRTADVPTIRITDWEGQYPEWTVMAYPKVGEENSEVRIGVVDVETGETRWLDVGIDGEHYIPRIYWTSDPNTLAVVTLNRPQNHLQLFFFDVRTGERRLVMEERSEAWIDVYDFFAGVLDYFYFPDGLDEFFWVSDRDGYNHLYRYSYDGELLNQVTDGDWVVTRVEGIDAENEVVYYTGTEASPLERQLYAIDFDGTNKRRLTETRGTHSIDMSPNAQYYIDRWSNTETPRQVELRSTDGELLQTLEDNAAVRAYAKQLAYAPKELFTFTTSDGQELDGSMIRPPDLDPTRPHPVVLSIYGGPGSQGVYDSWASNGWHQYLAQQGYIVVDLNNRGSGNYGRDFMEIVYGELGKWEAHDFAEVAAWLASHDWVDGDRMAIQGTSYGGFMAITTLLRHPGVFALGIANSPLTDWRLYDTIYAERYFGLLADNAEGYEAASTMNRVDALEDYLLLVHSGMDENVHPQNTMQLLTALARAGKDAELRFYPPGAHGAAFDFASYVTMTEVYTNALCEHVAMQCVPMNLNTN
ncbi:MAG: S9 family peptidase [Candidatus Longimicrobiales bacterium M2_2A_002]